YDCCDGSTSGFCRVILATLANQISQFVSIHTLSPILSASVHCGVVLLYVVSCAITAASHRRRLHPLVPVGLRRQLRLYCRILFLAEFAVLGVTSDRLHETLRIQSRCLLSQGNPYPVALWMLSYHRVSSYTLLTSSVRLVLQPAALLPQHLQPGY